MINILKTGIRQHFIVYVLLFLCFGSSQAEPRKVVLNPASGPASGPASDAELSVNQIYNKAIRSVVWILTKSGEGSGVLIDQELRFVVTNHHVVPDTEEPVVVIFPVRDKDGKLIEEQTFYRDERNHRVLLQLGYATLARVIAKDAKKDLAILELDGLPETARAINFATPLINPAPGGNKVHIIGNPEGKLWRWTAGFFAGRDKGMLRINAGTYGGNSGGPVLNANGKLTGIVTLSNKQTETLAVPVEDVNNVLRTLEPRYIFSIKNETEITITFHVKWVEDDDWEKVVIEPGYTTIRWRTSRIMSSDQQNKHQILDLVDRVPDGYPQVHFDDIFNDRQRIYSLKTQLRYFGSDIEDSAIGSGYRYYFDYNSLTQTVFLREKQ